MPAPAHTVRDRRRVTPDGPNTSAALPSGYQESNAGLLIPRSYAYSRTYEAANWSRTRTWRPTVATDSSRELTPAVRTVMMSHGRGLYENSGFVGGSIDDTGRYTWADGIYPLPLTGDPGLNRELRDDFLEWCPIADAGGFFHLFELGNMQVTTEDVDGDNFTILTSTDPGNPLGYPKVQLLRGHRVGNYGGEKDSAGFVDGIARDRAGIRRTVRVLNPDGDGFVDYDAAGVLHMMQGVTPDQVRQCSAIRRGINGMFDSREAMAAMHTKIKIDAKRATVIKNSQNGYDSTKYDDEVNEGVAAENLTFEMFADGEIIRLEPGEELQSESGDNPGQLFMPWMEFSFRDYAAGYGYPLEFLWKADLPKGALLFMLKKAQRRFQQRRNMQVIPKWLRRIYFYWLACMIRRKRYPRVPNWNKVAWQVTSPDLSLDGGRESAANLNEIRAGTRSLTEDAAERGRYWQELRAEKDAEARDLLDRAAAIVADYGGAVTMEMAIAQLQMLTPNGNGPAVSPPAPLDA